MSSQERICESTITPTHSHTNRIAGSGIRLPKRSIPSNIRSIVVRLAAPDSGGTMVSAIASAPALGEFAEERRLGGGGLLQLVYQDALVGRVDVRVAVGGADEQD